MPVILVGILTTKPLIFIKVRAGGHKQGRVAQLVFNRMQKLQKVENLKCLQQTQLLCEFLCTEPPSLVKTHLNNFEKFELTTKKLYPF